MTTSTTSLTCTPVTTTTTTIPRDTPPVKHNQEEVITATVDDVELLNILGITSTPSSPQQPIVVLDWEDMPELSEAEEEDDENQSTTTQQKRKYNEDDFDLFAEFDFVEVQPKKQKFVNEEAEDLLSTMNVLLPLDEDIRLALDLISSSN